MEAAQFLQTHRATLDQEVVPAAMFTEEDFRDIPVSNEHTLHSALMETTLGLINAGANALRVALKLTFNTGRVLSSNKGPGSLIVIA